MTDGADPADPRLDPHPRTAVAGERGRLMNLAYRMLGSLAEAEDVVQEAYARWYALPRRQQEGIDSPGAWLTTVATRVCLDQLRSARVRRNRYVGEWIPEPVPEPGEGISGLGGEGPVDPAERVTLDESVAMAFLVVLESMTPAERVAFVLHDVFGYRFAEVAEIVGRTPAACRQLASSARRRVRRSPAPVPASRAGIVRDFHRAWQARDIGALVGLLDPDGAAFGDGGGVVGAAPGPIRGAEPIARYLVDVLDRSGSGLALVQRTVNGEPGLVARYEGRTVAVYAFEVEDDRIRHIWAVLNPDKLRAWR